MIKYVNVSIIFVLCFIEFSCTKQEKSISQKQTTCNVTKLDGISDKLFTYNADGDVATIYIDWANNIPYSYSFSYYGDTMLIMLGADTMALVELGIERYPVRAKVGSGSTSYGIIDFSYSSTGKLSSMVLKSVYNGQILRRKKMTNIQYEQDDLVAYTFEDSISANAPRVYEINAVYDTSVLYKNHDPSELFEAYQILSYNGMSNNYFTPQVFSRHLLKSWVPHHLDLDTISYDYVLDSKGYVSTISVRYIDYDGYIGTIELMYDCQ